MPGIARVLSGTAIALLLAAAAAARGDERFTPKTRVTIEDAFWKINGRPTYPKTEAEGLLITARMANAVFDDLDPRTRPKDFDADANTDRFIAAIPKYRKAGITAFAFSLQGGDAGYEGAMCSAFRPDGSLGEGFMKRAARAIEACDREGMVVVLGLFHRLQDQVLRNETAVEVAVENAARWVKERGYTNVLLDIAEEYAGPGYDHEVFASAERMAELVDLAKKAAPGLLVSSNRKGTARIDPPVGNASDFLSTHFSGLPVDMISVRSARVQVYAKPIVCTADLRPEEEAVAALDASINALCSYGVALERNERYPFRYDGADDAPALYRRIKEITGG